MLSKHCDSGVSRVSRRVQSHCTIAAIVFAAALLFWFARAPTLPSYAEVSAQHKSSDAALLDRNGAVLHTRRIDFNVRRLRWLELSEISPALQAAVIRAEDKRFYSHYGVDWLAFADGVRRKLKGDASRGASTISMQLAALLLNQERQARRGWRQKLAQMRAALALERDWSKQQILAAYLNRVTFRGDLQGLSAASRMLLGKDASGITLREAVLLAALLPAPNAAAAQVVQRACYLGRTHAMTCDQLRQLEPLLQTRRQGMEREQLAPQLGQQLLRRAAESVRTTLDASTQSYVLRALQERLRELHTHEAQDAAAIVVENSSGDVLAYVGNGGELSSARYVDGVRALRQAGSTLKPFLYGLALEQRVLTAASLLDDTPINLTTPTGLYIPQNYDREFKGLVSVRTALAASLNIPAVRSLALVGTESFAGRLRELGYTSLRQPGDYYGYALALGSGEVSLLAQAGAYRALALGGRWSPLRLLASDARAQPKPVMNEQAAFIIADILADRAARSLSFGLESAVATAFWSAVKTGTSKDMRDNWCIGFSRDYTVAVWVGNFDGAPMRNVSGVSGAAPLWRDIMNYLHHDKPSLAPAAPSGLSKSHISFTDGIEAPREEWFLRNTETAAVQAVAPTQRAARIAYPSEGMIVALDPDVPLGRQTLFLRASGEPVAYRWRLNGQVLDAVGSIARWQPQPGKHVLELRDAQERMLGQVRFEVRGGA